MIPLTDCIPGHVYRIRSRNLGLGVFDGKEGFIGIREKFDQHYLFTEYHRDQGPPYGTVTPEEDLGPIPEEIPIAERLLNDFPERVRWNSPKKGDLWARRPPETEFIPVFRRDLEEGEAQHGQRNGFVDLWTDTGERMPDNQYPTLRQNQALFDFLKNFKGN